jgi:hypothetical protein
LNMKSLINHVFGKPCRKMPRKVTIENAENGFLLTEYRAWENYTTTYVARDLGELAQVIHQIYMAGTEGES